MPLSIFLSPACLKDEAQWWWAPSGARCCHEFGSVIIAKQHEQGFSLSPLLHLGLRLSFPYVNKPTMDASEHHGQDETKRLAKSVSHMRKKKNDYLHCLFLVICRWNLDAPMCNAEWIRGMPTAPLPLWNACCSTAQSWSKDRLLQENRVPCPLHTSHTPLLHYQHHPLGRWWACTLLLTHTQTPI